jgi:heme exporter protein A
VSLLRLEGVSCIRGGRLLFEGFDLTLGAGEGVRLVGPNGAGKSSLIRLAAGLLTPAAGRVSRSGEVTLADEGVALDRERRLGDALCWWEPRARVEAGMAALGLAELAKVPVRLLSTGQLRRARLARVMASASPLWLLDEPLNGLDDDGIDCLSRTIAAHRDRGGGVLAASHVPLAGEWRTVEVAT